MFKCEKCSYSTNVEADLIKHQNRKKPCDTNSPQKTVYVCEICDKEFAIKSNLIRHKKNCRVIDNKPPEIIESDSECECEEVPQEEALKLKVSRFDPDKWLKMRNSKKLK